MPYLMGGFPTLGRVRPDRRSVHRAGADLIELGVPYSDPLADGPVIHAAGTRALAAGASVAWVLEVARCAVRERPGRADVLREHGASRPGLNAFLERLAQTGACGLIVPDLPLEEAGEVRDAAMQLGSALVPLVAPTTTPERMAAIGASARGFLYTVSVVGTTGERDSLGERLAEMVQRAKASTHVPVALGFGIATPAQASQAADAGADGVIVGTRLVRAASEAADPPLPWAQWCANSPPGWLAGPIGLRRAWGCILTVTAGLVVWIVLWALGAKGFDAFMLATVIILVGAHR